MAASTPEIILYDLGSTEGICFSPAVWRVRLLLNYKKIPYSTTFLEFPDIEPTLRPFGLVPDASTSGTKYTVPAIHHLPSNTYLMESDHIAEFLASNYPSPPLSLTSDLGKEIKTKARAATAKAISCSIMPREIQILSPRAQEYFRRTREAVLGHPLEDLLDPKREEKAWSGVSNGMRAIEELLKTNEADGPFILGARPSYDDFFIAGALQSTRVVDGNTFQRLTNYPGFKRIYEACSPYLERKD
ncbi:hypothetical protein BKA67DRAFT_587318 [Truncatella angustata]|uniref:GST N-terminal domain-containing protein n=1 Tax=Truncatella angustata TaxID=152316 RepID=A0A9P8REU3_9PEZI|nr:uncharacterized protein BKA67DRAFT_587318 [Truncatella angustata]KAH6643293.1 hypothetical protein BKA67DRAFT_587318 [Truncatella angustata]